MDFGDPFDIFESFFGSFSFGAQGRRPQVPRYSMTISFMDAVHGVSKEVDVEGKARKSKFRRDL